MRMPYISLSIVMRMLHWTHEDAHEYKSKYPGALYLCGVTKVSARTSFLSGDHPSAPSTHLPPAPPPALGLSQPSHPLSYIIWVI